MIRFLLAFLLLLASASPLMAGDTTTNGYFYMPSLGASGASERTAWFNSLQATDGVIGLLRSGNYWTDGVNSTLTGETDLESANLTITGAWSFATAVVRLPTSTTLPTTDCDAADEAGRIYIDSDANTGQQLYVCEGLTGWVLSSGSGAANVSGWTDGGASISQTTTTDNVGIGTVSPREILEVVGNARISTSVITPKVVGGTSTTQSLTYQTTSGVGAFGADHIFKVGNAGATEAMRILNSGRVGIGTTNPVKPLTVVTGTANEGIRVTYTGASDPFNDARIAVGNNDGAAIANGDKLGSFIGEANDGTGLFEGGALVFKANGTWTNTSHPTIAYIDTTPSGSTSRTERWRIDDLGRMALGTTNPTSTATFIKRSSEPVLSISSAASQLNDYLVITSSGSVGIGTPLPQSLAQVKGGDFRVGAGTFNNSSSSDDAYVNGNLEVDGLIYGDGSQLTGIAGGSGGFTDGGANVYVTTTTDSVGIGTTTPSTTFEIVKQSSSIPLMVSSVPTGDGDLLIVRSGGNVGIGSVLPGSKLDIQGTMRASSMIGLGTTSGQLVLLENTSNGSNSISFLAPASITSDVVCALENDSTPLDGCISGGASAAGWTDGGTNVYNTVTTDTVGIGTTTPTGTLEIVQQGSVIPFMVSSVATGDGNRLIVTSGGNVGIGTKDAGNMLTVNGGIQSLSTTTSVFAPTDSPSACAAGTEGGIYYDNSLNEFCDCDGSSWAQIDGGGAC